jgi:hypothetical protein
MKRVLLCVVGLLTAVGCAQESTSATGNGTGNGGSAGTTSGSGGTTAGTGGSTGAAGASGGSTGAAGAAGGAAGGSTGAAGSTGQAGSGGAAGGAGGTGGISIASVVPQLDGYLWIGTCASGAPSTGNPTDCPIYPAGMTTCPNTGSAQYANRGALIDATIPVLGTTGTTYNVNMEVRGVTGLRCYNPAAAGQPSRVPPLATDVEGMSTGNDTWQVGGTPIDSLWNTWEFHVRNAAGTEVGVYYLNAVQPSSIYCQRHETFYIKFMTTFPVVGGGSILARIHDSNCAGQQNCGAPDSQPTCASPRTISLAGMDPPPPTTFTQPPVTNTYHPQWLFFDVKSVTAQ